MSGSLFSPIIDFCIGMSFFFLLLTLVCTMINEYLMDKLGNLRQKNLLEGISGLFYDAPRVVKLYQHPLITALYQDEQQPRAPQPPPAGQSHGEPGKQPLAICLEPFDEIMSKLPSYIPSRTFAAAFLDILKPAGETHFPLDCLQLRQEVLKIDNDRIKKALLPLIDAAQGDLEKARQNIARWYDDTMDRVGGWFKRQARKWLLVPGIVVCLVLNADTIMVGKILWQDPERLAAVVTEAQKRADADKTGALQPGDIQGGIKTAIKGSQLPLGWVWEEKPGAEDPRLVPFVFTYQDNTLKGITIFWEKAILKALGLFFTVLAISLGTPFWTDLLNSFVNLRRGGKKPATADGAKQ